MNTRRCVKPVIAVVLTLGTLALPAGLWASQTRPDSVVHAAPGGPDGWEAKWNRYQPADKVMDALGIKPGMVVAEFGAGRGRYAVQVAARVGATGKVYAEDIDAEALEYLKTRCARDTISNIETIRGDTTDPKLPPASCDFVYCINTYHHIGEPVPLLRNIIPALKPAGKLAIIEHTPEKRGKDGYKGRKDCTPIDSVLAQAREAGYEFVERHSFLELDEIYVFRAAKKGESAK